MLTGPSTLSSVNALSAKPWMKKVIDAIQNDIAKVKAASEKVARFLHQFVAFGSKFLTGKIDTFKSNAR